MTPISQRGNGSPPLPHRRQDTANRALQQSGVDRVEGRAAAVAVATALGAVISTQEGEANAHDQHHDERQQLLE